MDTTNKYVEWEVFERNASALTPAVNLVESIKAASNNLRKHFLGLEAMRGRLRNLIKEHFHPVHFRMNSYDQLFHPLGDVMSSLSLTCQAALAQMDDPDAKFFREGATWHVGFER